MKFLNNDRITTILATVAVINILYIASNVPGLSTWAMSLAASGVVLGVVLGKWGR